MTPDRKSAMALALWLALGLLFVGGGQSAHAAQPNAGGGAFTGDVEFTSGGIPPVNTPCRAASFKFSATAAITLANGAGSEGVWTMGTPLTAPMAGSGWSSCENAVIGGGNLTVTDFSVVNLVVSTRLTCSGVAGSYTRTGMDLAAVLAGTCAIDNFLAGKVMFYVRAEVVPKDGTGNGITTPVTRARFAGAFTVVPA